MTSPQAQPLWLAQSKDWCAASLVNRWKLNKSLDWLCRGDCPKTGCSLRPSGCPQLPMMLWSNLRLLVFCAQVLRNVWNERFASFYDILCHIFMVSLSFHSRSHIICSKFIFHFLFLTPGVAETSWKQSPIALSTQCQNFSSVWSQSHRLPGARGQWGVILELHTFYCQCFPNGKSKCNPGLHRKNGVA